jgi:hypothetical protein
MADTFDRAAWQAEIEADREATREYYLTQFNWREMQMPQGFEGPRFFPISEEWRKSARLDRDAPGTGMRVQLQTSIGDVRDFDVYGTFIFEHDGQEQHLTAYRLDPEQSDFDELFVPFKDATSGKQSYAAGRYMDVARHDSDDYVLDFNMAYNPSCAYNPRYNCPYPPPQNTLKVAVEAGEIEPIAHA